MAEHPLAGQQAPESMLINVPRLITAYFHQQPDPKAAEDQVSFGTSGHRGSSLRRSFTQEHILAIAQAVCEHRQASKVQGLLRRLWKFWPPMVCRQWSSRGGDIPQPRSYRA